MVRAGVIASDDVRDFESPFCLRSLSNLCRWIAMKSTDSASEGVASGTLGTPSSPLLSESDTSTLVRKRGGREVEEMGEGGGGGGGSGGGRELAGERG